MAADRPLAQAARQSEEGREAGLGDDPPAPRRVPDDLEDPADGVAHLPRNLQEQPVVGHLALFPSYFWHGTVPFQSADDRLTIAFDVVPGHIDPGAIARGPY